MALAEKIGASVWFEGLRHHAPFPTSHPNYRESLPGDAGQVRKALGDADLVLLLGGPFFEDIWYAAGSISRKASSSSRSSNRPSVWRSIIASMPAWSAISLAALPR